jgi:hypothetical protein
MFDRTGLFPQLMTDKVTSSYVPLVKGQKNPERVAMATVDIFHVT